LVPENPLQEILSKSAQILFEMKPDKYKTITWSMFARLRKKQWLNQNKCCPILKQPILYKDAVFDHKHRTKTETIGEDGKGLLRGVLHRNANTFEGKIVRLYKRYGLAKFIELPELLRNVAEYIEDPIMEPKYVHPSERPPAKKLGKRQYNKICKHYFEMYPRRTKLPEFPKSGKITKEFEELLKKIEKFL